MQIKSADFISSSIDISSCLSHGLPEYAFIGRSNVGKSSLINAICNRKKLAKTSSTPGKTQLINHFLINKQWYLVDLPGYGYAQTSKANRQIIGRRIKGYISERKQLIQLFVLVDIRHGPLENDLEFFKWVHSVRLPFVIVFTKSDTLKSSKIDGQINRYKGILSKAWHPLPGIFISSSVERFGLDEILKNIKDLNIQFYKSS